MSDQPERPGFIEHRSRNAGIWQITNFVNEFGDRTDSKYIMTTQPIRGNFSNSATQNSELNIKFIIKAADDVSIMLFEYAGNNPVKGVYDLNYYKVLMQDQNRKVTQMEGNISRGSERLSFNSEASKTIHDNLLKGGMIKFRITEDRTPTTKYSFDIDNIPGYRLAYSRLAGN